MIHSIVGFLRFFKVLKHIYRLFTILKVKKNCTLRLFRQQVKCLLKFHFISCRLSKTIASWKYLLEIVEKSNSNNRYSFNFDIFIFQRNANQLNISAVVSSFNDISWSLVGWMIERLGNKWLTFTLSMSNNPKSIF